MAGMVTVNGIRYRPEDAERLKVQEKRTDAVLSSKVLQPRNKAATPKNK